MAQITLNIELSDEEYNAWRDNLSANKDDPEVLVRKMIQQYNVFNGQPFPEYYYNENMPAPKTLDFSKKPLSRIHPLKRHAVETLLLSDIPETVDKIIIFGSAITLHCHPGSDLDICIVGSYKLSDERESPWLKTFSSQLGPKDILTYTPEQLERNFGVQDDINEKGVVVFEKMRRQCLTAV